MKILFLFPHFILPGGAAKVTLDFARGLQESGDTVEILCANATPQFLDNNSDLKITQISIPNSNSIIYWALLPYWQRKINKCIDSYPDYLLFPQVLPSNWWAWIYKLHNKDKKIVWYCHEPSAFIHSKKWINSIENPLMKIGAKILSPALRTIDVWLEKKNDLVVCNSHFTTEKYEKIYDRKAGAAVYPPLTIENVPLPKDKKNYIFTVGRISKFKNLALLIEAFESVSKKFPDYKLVIAGDGEEKDNLEKKVTQKNLQEKIIFLGTISDEKRSESYREAKATAMCSINEPFGIVPIESMMHGTPVIAHRSGGPKETIREGLDGFLFENKESLSLLMQKIITMDEGDYSKMQESCQARANKFESSKLIAKLKKIIEKA